MGDFISDTMAAYGGFDPPLDPPTLPPATAPYYTVGQLQAMVKEKTGKETASRNRPALLKRLGLTDVPRPADMKHDGRRDGDEPRVAKKAKAAKKKAAPKASKKVAAKKTAKVNGKRPGKPRPNKVKKQEEKDSKIIRSAIIRSDATLHATALAFVRKAMARKEPPSLRDLCAELRKEKVKKPRGGTNWWPSSVQNLMRQAGYDAGGKAAK